MSVHTSMFQEPGQAGHEALDRLEKMARDCFKTLKLPEDLSSFEVRYSESRRAKNQREQDAYMIIVALNFIYRARAAIDDNNASTAAAWAVNATVYIASLSSIARLKSLRQVLGGEARAKLYDAPKEQAKVYAEKLWLNDPDLSNSAVAEIIRPRLEEPGSGNTKAATSTIRRWIAPCAPAKR